MPVLGPGLQAAVVLNVEFKAINLCNFLVLQVNSSAYWLKNFTILTKNSPHCQRATLSSLPTSIQSLTSVGRHCALLNFFIFCFMARKSQNAKGANIQKIPSSPVVSRKTCAIEWNVSAVVWDRSARKSQIYSSKCLKILELLVL